MRLFILLLASISAPCATFTTIDFPVAGDGVYKATVYTQATGISPGGVIVGKVYYGFPALFAGPFEYGFILENGTFKEESFGYDQNQFWGINPTGDIVGASNQFGVVGILFQGGTATTIRPPGSTYTIARGISPSGVIVGSEVIGGQQYGFVLENGTFTQIAVPGGSSTSANGINPRGEIVGSYIGSDGRSRGFLLAKGRYTTISAPGSLNTGAFGINPRGEIVGSYQDANGVTHAFVFSGGSYTTIDPPGATSATAFGINPRGDIVGTFTDSTATHGFLLVNR